jgi:S-disulfanyl-L-cysteine oxidoreductase SoxD
MSSCREAVTTLRMLLVAASVALAAASAWAQAPQVQQLTQFPGIGRAATPQEVAAWDIDVRPDFKGLPRGAGTVAQGQDVWEAKCASCHGVFGESNEIFTPIVGGTTADDVRTGRVARLKDEGYPQRTTLMRVPTVSTLWDYVNRAMPWNAPKSLSVTEVYAVTAYMLHLADVLPAAFELSDRNIAEVQQRMPNRYGMSTEHAMWPGRSLPATQAVPDVRATACMSNCKPDAQVASRLPDHARNAHGNLAQQNRRVGAQIGADTTRPASEARAAAMSAVSTRPAAAPGAAGAATVAASAAKLAQQHQCLTCHGLDNKVVGPGLREITRKHAQRSDLKDYLVSRIREGGSGVWGPVPMPAQPNLSADDARTLALWLMDGAKDGAKP